MDVAFHSFNECTTVEDLSRNTSSTKTALPPIQLPHLPIDYNLHDAYEAFHESNYLHNSTLLSPTGVIAKNPNAKQRPRRLSMRIERMVSPLRKTLEKFNIVSATDRPWTEVPRKSAYPYPPKLHIKPADDMSNQEFFPFAPSETSSPIHNALFQSPQNESQLLINFNSIECHVCKINESPEWTIVSKTKKM